MSERQIKREKNLKKEAQILTRAAAEEHLLFNVADNRAESC